MRSIFFLSVLSIVFLASCSPKPEPPPKAAKKPESKDSVVAAPLTYVSRAMHAGNDAKATIEISAIQKAIEMFQQEEGRNPNSLDELVQKSYLKIMPKAPPNERFDYDPATAGVKLVPAPQGQ